MPLSERDLPEVRARVLRMLMDTISTFEVIERNADEMYGDRASVIRQAINEYLDDFIRNTQSSGEKHPEQLIYETSRAQFQRAGFYGAQLSIKEQQVIAANSTLRQRLAGGLRGLWHRPFRKWVDIINNFLSSLVAAGGIAEALKELKDCLRDELPDDDSQ